MVGQICPIELQLKKKKNLLILKVRKVTEIRNRYNQVPHLTKDPTCESEKTQLNITHKSQEVSPFQAGDHKIAKTDPKA